MRQGINNNARHEPTGYRRRPSTISGRRQRDIKATSGRHQGDVRATSARHQGDVRATSARNVNSSRSDQYYWQQRDSSDTNVLTLAAGGKHSKSTRFTQNPRYTLKTQLLSPNVVRTSHLQEREFTRFSLRHAPKRHQLSYCTCAQQNHTHKRTAFSARDPMTDSETAL